MCHAYVRDWHPTAQKSNLRTTDAFHTEENVKFNKKMLSNSSSRFFFDYNLLERIYGSAAELGPFRPFRQWNSTFFCAQNSVIVINYADRRTCAWVAVLECGAMEPNFFRDKFYLHIYSLAIFSPKKRGKRSKAHAMAWNGELCAGKASYPLLMAEITMRWQYSWREEANLCTHSAYATHTLLCHARNGNMLKALRHSNRWKWSI